MIWNDWMNEQMKVLVHTILTLNENHWSCSHSADDDDDRLRMLIHSFIDLAIKLITTLLQIKFRQMKKSLLVYCYDNHH